MSKIAGVGELREGVLERDPMDEGFQLRVRSADGTQQILRLQDLLAEYVGHQVRFTIAYSAVLAAAERTRSDLQGVSFADLSKSS